MKITMFGNFADPQILPFCEKLDELTGKQFVLAATEPFPSDLLEDGYPDTNGASFVKRLYESKDALAEAGSLIRESDVLIYAHCPKEYFDLCVRSGKPVFRFSQHLYRDGNLKAISLKQKGSNYLRHTMAMKNKPVYLMCISTYTAMDYSLTNSYEGKRFEFGAFPEVFSANAEALRQARRSEPPMILWANEFSDITHPEVFLDLVKNLKDRRVRFVMAGKGPRYEEIQARAADLPIEFVTPESPQNLQELLKQASVFVMTSDYREGWGNILNRAMNACLACVVSTAVGSAKLIDMPGTGLLYETGNTEDLTRKVSWLLDHPEEAEAIGASAEESIRENYNGEEAAKRFLKLAEAIKAGKGSPFETGLCAPAQVIRQEDLIQKAHSFDL
ncbi:MAG: glycosyltransferase family 4 protein [Solobacterium sp.]|nr:glycosyltransferase family 4 protein [Solobacterium sp.]